MTKHPATYNDKFIPIFAELLLGCANVLDPFAGTGKIAEIKKYGYRGNIICNEIEHEWMQTSKYDVDEWHIGDAQNMDWVSSSYFDAICTSPTYGNRMADHFNSMDNSKRVTYRHFLGRDLNIENTGKMQWGKKYREKHCAVLEECFRVLKLGGIFIINISNHIRNGVIVDVIQWYKDTFNKFGLILIKEIFVNTPRMRFGVNADKRVDFESILVFKK